MNRLGLYVIRGRAIALTAFLWTTLQAVAQVADPSPAAPSSPANVPFQESPGSTTNAQPPSLSATSNWTTNAIQLLRDPFWPIGWTPPSAGEAAEASGPVEQRPKGPVRWDEAARQLEVTALTQLPTGGYVAVLKGLGVFEKGDTISVNYGGLTYRWEVQSITSEGIVPKRLNAIPQRGN